MKSSLSFLNKSTRLCEIWLSHTAQAKYWLNPYAFLLFYILWFIQYPNVDRKTIDMWWTGRDLEGSCRGLIETFSRNLPGGTEKTKEYLGISGRDANWALRTQVCSVTATLTRPLSVCWLHTSDREYIIQQMYFVVQHPWNILLHVSAPRCRHQGVIGTETCRSICMSWMLYYQVNLWDLYWL
jgi:hypothetical protein